MQFRVIGQQCCPFGLDGSSWAQVALSSYNICHLSPLSRRLSVVFGSNMGFATNIHLLHFPHISHLHH